MSGKDRRGTAGGRTSGTSRADGAQAAPSRRALLRGAAGAGVAGVAASTLIGLPGAQALASSARPAKRAASGGPAGAARSVAGQPAGGAEGAGPASDVVVHVRDARSGEMDIFSGTSMARLNDPDLARRLIRAIE